MPRRKPATVAPQTKPEYHLSADYLGELLTQAKVPKASREACARDVSQALDFYNRRLARVNAPSEASRAESLRLVSEAATQLAKTLAALPPALRLAVEPDYRKFIATGFARHIARADAEAAAQTDAARCNPVVQAMVDEHIGSPALLPQAAREDVQSCCDELLSRARTPLPLELVLAALTEMAERRRAEAEALISRPDSKRRSTFWRNQLARNLKAIGAAYSPVLADDERQAEDWAASVLCVAGILYPARETNPTAFRSMFGRKRRKLPI